MQIVRFLKWGAVGEASVEGAAVPAGKVWLIQTCGIGTNDGKPRDYMMQHIVPPGWFVPIARAPQAGSTPVLAVERSIIMQEGEYLAARVNTGGDPTYKGMVLLYSGWEFPASDLPALLYRGSVSVTTPAVDYSGFQSALSAASQALSDAAAAVP